LARRTGRYRHEPRETDAAQRRDCVVGDTALDDVEKRRRATRRRPSENAFVTSPRRSVLRTSRTSTPMTLATSRGSSKMRADVDGPASGDEQVRHPIHPLMWAIAPFFVAFWLSANVF